MSWLLGVSLSVAATLCGTLGKVLMKLSHMRGGDMIIFGFAITLVVVLNPLLDAMSYGYAAQSILAPMSGLSVVWNIMLSPYLLKESLRHTDVLGTVFVVVGCMIVGLSGCHDTPDHPTAELLQLFVSESFLMYMLFSGVWISALYWIIQSRSQRSHLRRFAFGALAGTIGGNLFFVKAFVELAKNGHGVWHLAGTYLILACALLSAGGGLYILNIALKQYEAIYLVSVYQSFLIIIGAVSGVVFFDELADISTVRRVAYVCGLFTAIIGIRVLTTSDEPGKADPLLERGAEFEPLLVSQKSNAHQEVLV